MDLVYFHYDDFTITIGMGEHYTDHHGQFDFP